MMSFDANLAVYAANRRFPEHERAFGFIGSLARRQDVAICDLMLVELYLKLCNARIFEQPLRPEQAAAVCRRYRDNRIWKRIESAPVMDAVWAHAERKNFAFRRIIDMRLALTLQHHGVTEFATANVADFEGLGFERVWNPLQASD